MNPTERCARAGRLIGLGWTLCAVLSVRSAAQYRFVREDAALRAHFDQAGWEFIARQPCRQVAWSPDVTSAVALARSAAPLRRDVLEQVGPLPTSLGIPRVLKSTDVYFDSTYVVTRVTISGRFPISTVVGYLARPKNALPDAPVAVVLHGANSSPEQVFGWRATDTDALIYNQTLLNSIGTALLAQGFIVFAPFIADDYQFDHVFAWDALSNVGEAYRMRTGRGGTLSLVIGLAQASVDYARSQSTASHPRTLMVGWGEGAFVGSLTAALDPRVDAVVNLVAPRDGRAFRSTVAGVRISAAFAHYDCTIGHVEQAAMLAPRPLLFAWADDALSVLRAGQSRSATVDAELDRIYRVASPGSLTRIDLPRTGSAVAYAVARWAGRALNLPPIKDSIELAQPTDLIYPREDLAATTDSLKTYIATLGGCPRVPSDVTLRDSGEFRIAAETLRQRVSSELGLRKTPAQRRTRVVTRQLLRAGPDYRLEWVVLRSDGEAREIGGLLGTPLAGSKHPALLSFDANYGLSYVFGLLPAGRTAYLNAYGDDFARAGVVVFAPYRPTLVSRAPALLSARGGMMSRLEFDLDLARASLDFLLDEPTVDVTDVVAYGISEAAYAAVYTAAFDQRVTGVVFSNPLVSHAAVFRLPVSVQTNAWQTQVCSTIDATLKYLIAPRRLTWEGDGTNLSLFPEPVLSFPSSISAVYQSIGASDAFLFRRHLSGHETHPMEIRDALPFKRVR